MKDFYKRLRLSPRTSDPAQLRNAIEGATRTDPSIAIAASHVLLNPARKQVYDRTHATLEAIGQLRANLRLLNSPHWCRSGCGDFSTLPTSDESPWQRLRASSRESPAKLVARFVLGTLLGRIAVGLAIIVALALFSKSGESTLTFVTSEPTSVRSEPAPFDSVTAPTSTPKDREAARVSSLVSGRLKRAGKSDPQLERTLTVKLLSRMADPLPQTGLLSSSFTAEAVAPLSIVTNPGANYFVKLVDSSTQEERMTVFIRGGEPFETLVPLGSYTIKYASGINWYGTLLDFGDMASYSRCEDRFEFLRTQTGYSGYTVELIVQRNGNLDVAPISADAF